MKLFRVHVKEFQSVRDSKQFNIGDITCLVGKNEAGKTSILKALYKLNPIIATEGKFDITDDYPRTDVEDYQQKIENKEIDHARVIEATFELDVELEDIYADLGKDALKSNQLVLSKGYDNLTSFVLPTDQVAIFKHIINSAGLLPELKEKLLSNPSFEKVQEILKAEEQTEETKRLGTLIGTILKKGLNKYVYELYVEKMVPKFLYFDEYSQLRGQENIETLMQRKDQNKLRQSDHPMLGLIELARLDLKELLNPERTQTLINKIEGASNHLSKQILKYWSQNKHLRMRFDVRPGRPGDPEEMRAGTNLWASVYDQKHFVTTSLGSRSRGFVWFFSFLAWYSKIKKDDKLILLLDEPGLALHAKAQQDLLRYFENELKEKHQLIYTTHSPFMVDAQNFSRVRIVQDKSIDTDDVPNAEDEGTKVITDVLEATADSLFPLQGALGYEISQTLFVGPNCLIVEGVSDLLYIQSISAILASKGKVSLSTNWTVTPVGGADKVPTFVALLGSQKDLNIATLIDYQKKDQQSIENLFKKKLLQKTNVLTFADFTGKSESDIEDMFDSDFYIALVNGEYKKDLTKPIEETGLDKNNPRIVFQIEEFFKKVPLKSGGYNHYRPARFLSENIASYHSQISENTLSRFEKVFETLNKLISR